MGNKCCLTGDVSGMGDELASERDAKNKNFSLNNQSNNNSVTQQAEFDGYSSSSILTSNYASNYQYKDPNYSSQEIGLDHFQIVKVIGRGSFGKVYMV